MYMCIYVYTYITRRRRDRGGGRGVHMQEHESCNAVRKRDTITEQHMRCERHEYRPGHVFGYFLPTAHQALHTLLGRRHVQYVYSFEFRSSRLCEGIFKDEFRNCRYSARTCIPFLPKVDQALTLSSTFGWPFLPSQIESYLGNCVVRET